MLVPRYSTGWSVAKLFLASVGLHCIPPGWFDTALTQLLTMDISHPDGLAHAWANPDSKVHGANVGPMLAPWTLLSAKPSGWLISDVVCRPDDLPQSHTSHGWHTQPLLSHPGAMVGISNCHNSWWPCGSGNLIFNTNIPADSRSYPRVVKRTPLWS